eukprot:PhM_4_TR11254/c0_g1_i10/m.69976
MLLNYVPKPLANPHIQDEMSTLPPKKKKGKKRTMARVGSRLLVAVFVALILVVWATLRLSWTPSDVAEAQKKQHSDATEVSSAAEHQALPFTPIEEIPPSSDSPRHNPPVVSRSHGALSGASERASHPIVNISEINVRRDVPLTRHALFTCPRPMFPGFKTADGSSVREAMRKYSGYTRQYCNTSGLMQMHFQLSHYLFFLRRIGEIVKLKPNDVIMDWGSGCGTMMNYFHLLYNTTGVGLDVTEVAVQHARLHAQPGQLFCHTDATRGLKHFRDNTFDAIVSWAALYHVRRTLQQCETVNELARIVKPGGVIYMGHLRTEKTQKYWTKGRCQVQNATYARTSDARTFHVSSFKRHGFFSLVIRKNMAA